MKKIYISIIIILTIVFFAFQFRYYFQIVIASTRQTLIQSKLIKKDIHYSIRAYGLSGELKLNSGDVVLIPFSGALKTFFTGNTIIYGVQSYNYLYRLPLYHEWLNNSLGGQSRTIISSFSNLLRFVYGLQNKKLYSYSALSFFGDNLVQNDLSNLENITIPDGMLNEIGLNLSGYSFECSGDTCISLEDRIDRLFHMSNIIIDRAFTETKNPLLYNFHTYKSFSGYIVPFNDPQTSYQTSFIIIKSLEDGVVLNYELLNKDPISLEQKKFHLERFVKLLNP